jgi:glycosyltransferase involved in cell wall biosynthesis
VNIWREVQRSGGGLVGTDDLDGVTDILDRFLALSESEWEQMGRCARTGFFTHFDIKNAARNLLDVIGTRIRPK